MQAFPPAPYASQRTSRCATPFKEKKSSLGGRKKAKPEKGIPSILRTPLSLEQRGQNTCLGGGLADPDSFYQEFENFFKKMKNGFNEDGAA